MSELQRLRVDHASAVLAFERANRAYFAESISDRGDAYFERFLEHHDAALTTQDAGTDAYYLLIDEHGSVEGRFNLYDIKGGTAEVGYRVAKHVAGRGVATEAVRELCRLAATCHGLSTLRAAASVENVASQRVLVKAGFVTVGPGTVAGKPATWYQLDVVEPKEIVRRGYDAASLRYDEAYGADTKYQVWLDELRRRVLTGGTVLDLGCGSGVPVARSLAASGRRVVGVDLSGEQVRRARQRVPGAEFIQADATKVDFDAASFDAVVCLYSLIHVPLAEQRPLIQRVAEWLRPGSSFLATTGSSAWTGQQDDWLGSGATMWWSQTDAATYREWIGGAGLTIEREEFVPEGGGGHALFWARKPV